MESFYAPPESLFQYPFVQSRRTVWSTNLPFFFGLGVGEQRLSLLVVSCVMEISSVHCRLQTGRKEDGNAVAYRIGKRAIRACDGARRLRELFQSLQGSPPADRTREQFAEVGGLEARLVRLVQVRRCGWTLPGCGVEQAPRGVAAHGSWRILRRRTARPSASIRGRAFACRQRDRKQTSARRL
jgi:hypothetical protein